MGTTYEKEVYGKCPACGGDIVQGEKNYYCANYKAVEAGGKGCKVHLSKLIMGHTFSPVDVRDFFTFCKMAPVEGTLASGNKVEFYMVYDSTVKEIVPRYTDEQMPLGKCPKCGKGIYIGKQAYFCAGYKDEPKCEFILWKETEGCVFTPEMAHSLLAGMELKDQTCEALDGKKYTASFRLGFDGGLVKRT